MILNIVNHSHILNQSPAGSSALPDCLAQLERSDALLLIEDGIYAALDAPINQAWLARCPQGVSLYALAEDISARGLEGALLPIFKQIDYAGFVDLAVHHPLSQSWF